MQFSRTRSPRMVSINLMPLIDVMLVLIIFLVLATTFVLASGMKVDLPPGQSGERSSEGDIIVVVTQDGAVYYRDAQMDLQTLQGALSQAQHQRPGARLVVQADKSVQHGRVVEVMDMAKAVGISRLAIATAPKKVPQQ